MFGKNKYVFVEIQTQFGTIDAMFIFPNYVTHSNFVKMVDAIEVHSAGFIDGDICFGGSESLNVRSNPEIDNKILKNLLHGNN